ncbi:MAG: cellulose biosynthesis cyclic di-GMP-binding regulatory protein BcsB [Perlucidibaca sp.]
MIRRLIALLLTSLPLTTLATQALPDAATTAPVAMGVPTAHTVVRTFKDLGSESFDLRGLNNNAYLNVGVRLDEVVTAARLKLQLNYSPALMANLSHIKVYLNNEVVGVVPLPHQDTPTPVTGELSLDPRFFSDYNQLRLQLIGHYSPGCEDPDSSAVWASLGQGSSLTLSLQPLTLQNDLSLLPAPFFDRHDNRRLELPFVFAAAPDKGTLAAAGVAASWLGVEAGYRGARFPVLLGQLPARHAVVFARNGEQIAGLRLPDVKGPTVDMVSLAGRPAVKYLVVRGRDAADLRKAAAALALGQVLMTGSQARITAVDLGPLRKSHDAPNWVRTDRPIRFAELIKEPWELQRSFENRDPVRLNLRLPPDLFTWRIRGIDMDLRYRYTPPMSRDNSSLSVFLNNQFVRAYTLDPAQREGRDLLHLPVLDEGSIMARQSLEAPPFYVGVANQLQIHYNPEVRKNGLCSSLPAGAFVAAVDPDSSIDFSRYPNYIIMPSLGAFAQAGFPFTRYADLAQTTIVLPEHPLASDISALLNVMARFGAATGYPGTRVTVAGPEVLKRSAGHDILALGIGAQADLLAGWADAMPSYLGKVQRVLRSSRELLGDDYRWLTDDGSTEARRDILVSLSASGHHAALVGFESPVRKGRSVVSLSATDPAAMQSVFDALDRSDLASRIQGDVALVQGERVDSFRVGSTYALGHLPFWTRLWLIFSDRPLLLAGASILIGLLMAMLMFFGLNYLAKRRLVK